MKKIYGIIGIGALLALTGCQSGAENSPPPPDPIVTESPVPTPEPTPAPTPEPSEIDLYIQDVRGESIVGNLQWKATPFTGVSDSDLLRAGYAFCDYVQKYGEDVNYRLALTMTSVLDFPESVSESDDGNTVKLSAVATKYFCTEHAEPMSEWMENFEG